MTTRTIQFDAPGIVAVGDYRPGQPYTVDAEEAARLVEVKGARYADEPKAMPDSHYPPHVIEPAVPGDPITSRRKSAQPTE